MAQVLGSSYGVGRVLLRASFREWAALQGTAARSSVVFCSTNDEVLRRVSDGDVVGLVVEQSDLVPSASLIMPPWRPELLNRPLIVRIVLPHLRWVDIVRLADAASDLRVSVRGSDVLADEIEAVLERPAQHTADHALIRMIGLHMRPETWPIVLTAAMMSRRRTHVSELARACGVSPRTLEHRLRTLQLPHARSLLGLLLSAHAMHRCVWSGWSPKRVALAAGFASEAAMSNYMFRHSDTRPRNACMEGFSKLLDRLGALGTNTTEAARLV